MAWLREAGFRTFGPGLAHGERERVRLLARLLGDAVLGHFGDIYPD